MAVEKRAREDLDELPAAPLGTMLQVLRSTLGTSRVSLWVVDAGQICCWYCPAELVSRAEGVWVEHRSDILAGTTIRHGDRVYFPLVKERVTGVLEVVGIDERGLDRCSHAMFMCALRMLPETLRLRDGAAANPVPDALEAAREAADHAEAERVMRVALEELERQRLLALLDRHEWVVSAVARADDVDRVTIYRRMEKFGLRRREPSPKAPRHRRGRLVLRPA